MATIKQESVSTVFVTEPDKVTKYEVINGQIVRCRSGRNQGDMGFRQWGEDDVAIVAHLLAMPDAKQMIEFDWHGRKPKGMWTDPAESWVIRRKDGMIHQIHPGYVAALARQRFAELESKEAGPELEAGPMPDEL